MAEELERAPAPAVKALSCPSCGGAIAIKAAGYTVTVACQYCSSILDVANPDVRLIAEYHEAVADLEIPLGTRGTIDGVEWEAIGHMNRSENGSYPWEEYLLFNPYRGYRWLVTDGRGWSFGEMLTRTPGRSSGDGPTVDGKAYKPFFENTAAQVDHVVGEFYWRVSVGEEVIAATFVRPGWMLSREANGSEVNWTLLRLLDQKEMSEAFGVGPPRRRKPPMPHQPPPYHGVLGKMAGVGCGTLLFLVLLAILFSGGSVVLRDRMTLPQTGTVQTATFGPVTFDRGPQAVAIQAHAPSLSNAWVDLDYALVDRRTQVSYQAYGLAERYSGRDSEGNWTEGNRRSTIKMASVPAGTYDLVVEAGANRWTAARPQPTFKPGADPIEVDIVVRQGAFFVSNLVLAAIVILIPLVAMGFRYGLFETERNQESDFAPSEDDD